MYHSILAKPNDGHKESPSSKHQPGSPPSSATTRVPKRLTLETSSQPCPRDGIENHSLVNSFPALRTEARTSSSSHTRRNPTTLLTLAFKDSEAAAWPKLTPTSPSSSPSNVENIRPSSISFKARAPGHIEAAQATKPASASRSNTARELRLTSSIRSAMLSADDLIATVVLPATASDPAEFTQRPLPSLPHPNEEVSNFSVPMPLKGFYSIDINRVTALTPLANNHTLLEHHSQSLGPMLTSKTPIDNQSQHTAPSSIALNLASSSNTLSHPNSTQSPGDTPLLLASINSTDPPMHHSLDPDLHSLKHLKSLSHHSRPSNTSLSTFFTAASPVSSDSSSRLTNTPTRANIEDGRGSNQSSPYFNKSLSSHSGSPPTSTSDVFASDLSVSCNGSSKYIATGIREHCSKESVETILADHSPVSVLGRPSIGDHNQPLNEELDDEDWEDAVTDDTSLSRSAKARSNHIDGGSRARPPGVPPSSDELSGSVSDASKALEGLSSHTRIEGQRRSLTIHPNWSSTNSLSSKRRSKLGHDLSCRNSVISLLSVTSNCSFLSISPTDDGGEYEDAADQAEWMDIDGGGAYEDLDRAEEIVREVSRQSAIDQAQALQKAAEARRRYSALSEAQRLNDTILVTATSGASNKRFSSLPAKDPFHYANVTDAAVSRRSSNTSDGTTSSLAISRRGSRCGDNCDAETHDMCGRSSPSNQQRDSISSRGSRVMLFTRNSKALWGRNSPRQDDTGELDPIVEVENCADDSVRNIPSPFSQDSCSGHGHAEPSAAAAARWRPRPLFLKPVGTPSGMRRRSTNEGQFEYPSSSSVDSHGSQYRNCQSSSSNGTAGDGAVSSESRQGHGARTPDSFFAGTTDFSGVARSDPSNSSKIFHSQEAGPAQVMWPSSLGSASTSGVTFHDSESLKAAVPGASRERRMTVVGVENARPQNRKTSNPSLPATHRDGRPRLQSLHSSRSIVFNIRSQKSTTQATPDSPDSRTTFASAASMASMESFTEGQLDQVGLSVFLNAAQPQVQEHGPAKATQSPARPSAKSIDLSSSTNTTHYLTTSSLSLSVSLKSHEMSEHSTQSLDKVLESSMASPIVVTNDMLPTSLVPEYHASPRLVKTSLSSDGGQFAGTNAFDHTFQTDTTNATLRSPTGSLRTRKSDSQDSLALSRAPNRAPRSKPVGADHSGRLSDLSTKRPIAPSRSQTFGRQSAPKHSTPLPDMPEHQGVLSEDPFSADGPAVKSVRVGGPEKARRQGMSKKAISTSPIQLVPSNFLRGGSQSVGPSPLRTSFERLPRGLTIPGEIASLADGHPSALPSWPSWAGRSNAPAKELDPPTPQSAEIPSSSRTSPYSPGNSSVMEYAYENGGMTMGQAFLPEARSQAAQTKRAELWDASTFHSVLSAHSLEDAREANSLESQLQSLAKMRRGSSLPKATLIDVRRDPEIEMASRKPTLRMIRGRSKIISGPIKLDPTVESQALWKMISGTTTTGDGLTGNLRKNSKKK